MVPILLAILGPGLSGSPSFPSVYCIPVILHPSRRLQAARGGLTVTAAEEPGVSPELVHRHSFPDGVVLGRGGAADLVP